MYETRHIQYRITSGYISIYAGEYLVRAFWAHPEPGGEYPGLVLLHENLTVQTRALVRRLAETGFYVIAPDLYDGQVMEDTGVLREQLITVGPERVTAAIDALRTHNRCNGNVGIIGWGVGGELAYHAALRYSDLNAVVVFYAKPDLYIDGIATDDTPILALYGDADPDIRPNMLNKLSQAMLDSPAQSRLVIYPDAKSGFGDAESPNYHAEFAANAWGKTLDFLREKLDVPRHWGGQMRPGDAIL
jgi:carboxymethylenebutenolidase